MNLRKLSTAALILGALTTGLSASPASASATAVPHCWGGTDGGRQGQVWCDGPAGHVKLVTECVWAQWADSGWMWKDEGAFYYSNTCWFGAAAVHIYVSS